MKKQTAKNTKKGATSGKSKQLRSTPRSGVLELHIAQQAQMELSAEIINMRVRNNELADELKKELSHNVRLIADLERMKITFNIWRPLRFRLGLAWRRIKWLFSRKGAIR